jgi:DNA-binding response OmpR family regulator
MPTRPTILIVENDQATHQMYERALQQEYQVLVASGEADVPTLLNTYTVQAIVLEPGPVGSSGWALLAELKQRPDLSSVPLIVCTAQDERSRGLKLGVTAYLVKPVLPATLLETVRRLILPASPTGELL